jgi:fucose permease
MIPLFQAMFVNGVVIISVGPLLPAIMPSLSISLSRAGIIALGLFLGRALGGLALLSLFARVPVHHLLRWAYLLESAVLIVGGLVSTGLWSLFALYLIVGFAAAMPSSITGMWVSYHVRQATAHAMTLVVAPYAFATVVTPWVVGALLGAGTSWRWILVGEGVLSAFAGLVPIGRYLPDVPDRRNLRLTELRKVHSFNPGMLVAILAASFAYVGMESAFGVWLPKFHESTLGAGITAAAFTVTVFWMGQLIGRLTIVRLVRRLSASTLAAMLATAGAVLSLGIAWAPSYWVSVPIVLALGLATSALWPLIGGYCSRFPSWHAGVVYTLMGLVGALGSALFPYAMGPAASSIGFRWTMALLAIPALAVAGACLLLGRAGRTKN